MAARRKASKGRPRNPRTPETDLGSSLAERARPKKDDETKLWEARLQYAAREMEGRLAVYDENEKAYYNETLSRLDYAGRRLPEPVRQYAMKVNKFLPILATQRQRVLPKVPWYRLIPQKPQDRMTAMRMRAGEGCLNFLVRSKKMRFRKKSQLFLLGAELGVGALEVTYTPDEGVDPEEGKEKEYGTIEVDEDEETGQEMFEIEGGDPKLTEEGELVRRGGKVELDLRDPLDYFGLSYIHWQSLLWDPECGNDEDEMGWLGTRFSMKLEQALKNPIFKTTDKEEMRRAAKSLQTRSTTDIIRPPRPHEKLLGQGSDDFLRLTGWRIWDIEKREVLYFVDGLPKLAAKYEYPTWVGRHPLIFLSFHQRLQDFAPLTEVEHARPMLNAYNIFWGVLLNHLKRFKRKYGARPNAFRRPEQRDHLLDPDDGAVLELLSKDSLWAIEDAYLDPAIYKMMQQVMSDFHEIMASAPEFIGVAESGSATQAAIIDRRGVGREDEKREILAESLEEVGDKMLANLQNNLPQDLAVRIVGPDGRKWRKTYARPDIQGQFASWIDLAEMTPQGKASIVQEILPLLQILGPEFLASEPLSRNLFRALTWPDPDVAADVTKLATLMAAQKIYGPGGQKPNGGKPGQTEKPRPGGYKATGKGPEGGRTTEGRSVGRAARARGEKPTLLGRGSTPSPETE